METDLEKFHSPMDALQWMGAVRMRVQTADKNITIIHTTPVHQVMSSEAISCVFVRNKFSIFNFKLLFAYESSIHNNVQWKVVLSELGEKHAQIKYHLQAKTVLN